jgi:hypothetical protein
MKRYTMSIFLICAVGASVVFAQRSGDEAPRVFLMDAQKLQKIRQSVRAKDKTYDDAVAAIERKAQKALRGGTKSDTTKSDTPPSREKH